MRKAVFSRLFGLWVEYIMTMTTAIKQTINHAISAFDVKLKTLMPEQPTANLADSRYDFAVDTLSRLGSALPSNTILDIGAGDGRMKRIETLGLAWQGFDLIPSSIEITPWDLNTPHWAAKPWGGSRSPPRCH